MSTPQELAAAKLLVEMRGWRSIEFQAHTEQINRETTASGGSRSENVQFDYRYIETSKGQRYADSLGKGPGGVVREEAFCDGKRCANMHYEYNKPNKLAYITIERSFMREANFPSLGAPDPRCHFFAGRIPLYEAIARAVHLRSSRVLGRDCDVFLLSKVPMDKGATAEEIYYLDRATGVPLRLEFYNNPDAIPAGRWNYMWEASTLDTVQGYHFPLHSSFQNRAYAGPEPTARYSVDTTAKVEVKDLHYDRPYPATAFWPEPRTDVTVFDSFKGKITQATTIDPDSLRDISAEQPEGGALLSKAGTWSLVLGFVILVVALVVWVRRR